MRMCVWGGESWGGWSVCLCVYVLEGAGGEGALPLCIKKKHSSDEVAEVRACYINTSCFADVTLKNICLSAYIWN